MARAWRQRRSRVAAKAAAPSEYEELLSLDHIRERLADKWPLLRQSVFKLTGKLIERHKHGPVSFARDKEHFLLTFRCTSQDEARQHTLEIADAIDKAIFGNLHAHELGPLGTHGHSTAQPRTGGWGVVRLLKRFTTWLIKGETANSRAGQAFSASENGQAVPANPMNAASAAGWEHSGKPHLSEQPASVSAATANRGPEVLQPRPPVALVPIASGAGLPVTADRTGSMPLGHPPEPVASSPDFADAPTAPDEISAIEALLVQEGDRLASEQEELARATQFPPNDIQCVYRPIWSIRTSMLGLSTCFPASIRSGTELCVGYSVLPERHTAENVSFLDELVLRHVIEQCRVVEAAGRPPLIVVPVHYENLSDPDRIMRYRDLCEEVPRAARRFLSFELWGIGEAYGHQQVISILSMLRRYSALQFGNLSCGQATLAFWKTAGLHGIGVNIDEWGRQHATEKDLIEALERFRLCAYRSGLRSYARGVPNRSVALACVAAGYDFLDGTVIQRHLEPATVSRFGLNDLYGLGLT